MPELLAAVLPEDLVGAAHVVHPLVGGADEGVDDDVLEGPVEEGDPLVDLLPERELDLPRGRLGDVLPDGLLRLVPRRQRGDGDVLGAAAVGGRRVVDLRVDNGRVVSGISNHLL